MRRTSLLALVAATLLVAAATMPAGAAPPTKVGVAYYAAGLGDLSFNDMAQSGALQAEADFGIKLFEREQVKRSGKLIESETVLGKLAKKSDLVVAVGFTYGGAAELAASADPDTHFAVIDWAIAAPLPNLLSTGMATNEGSFLVGAAAALESTSGQIGFIGGVSDLPVILEYVAGVDYIDLGASVTVDHVSEFPDLGGFNNPEGAYEIAMGMYQSGIDVIYHAAGLSGLGLFYAARDYSNTPGNSHVWAIGVDADQYLQVPDDLKPYILTSMIKRVDVVTYDVIESQVLGTFAGGFERWDLSRNGVDYATSGGFIDGYVPTLEGIRQDIIDGLITVPLLP